MTSVFSSCNSANWNTQPTHATFDHFISIFSRIIMCLIFGVKHLILLGSWDAILVTPKPNVTTTKQGLLSRQGKGSIAASWRKGGAFCSVFVFHNQKVHVYLIIIFIMSLFYHYLSLYLSIYLFLYKSIIPFYQSTNVSISLSNNLKIYQFFYL